MRIYRVILWLRAFTVLIDYFDKVTFHLPGISTPSEIIYGINQNLKYFKFFQPNVLEK